MNKTILIISICLPVAIIFMLAVYSDPESFGLTKPYTRIGPYDGTLPEEVLIISDQCHNKGPFKDYGFSSYSNGHYYIDNVICEMINVERGDCIEPIYDEDSDGTECGNYGSYDYPYGETGPEFNEEFCNQLNRTYPLVQKKKDSLYSQYQYICNERKLATITVNPHAASWAWETPDVCTDDMIRHLLKNSTMFDDNLLFEILLIGLPDGMNTENFNQCVEELLEIKKKNFEELCIPRSHGVTLSNNTHQYDTYNCQWIPLNEKIEYNNNLMINFDIVYVPDICTDEMVKYLLVKTNMFEVEHFMYVDGQLEADIDPDHMVKCENELLENRK